MTKLIAEIANSLNQTRQQAQMFRRAAYYDSSQANAPIQSLKEGGAKLGADPDAFQRLLDGADEQAAEAPAVRESTAMHGHRQPSGPDDNQVVNIDIVELSENKNNAGRSSATPPPGGEAPVAA